MWEEECLVEIRLKLVHGELIKLIKLIKLSTHVSRLYGMACWMCSPRWCLDLSSSPALCDIAHSLGREKGEFFLNM